MDWVKIVALGEGAGQVPLGERNAVYRGVARAFAFAAKTRAGLRLEIDNQIRWPNGLDSGRVVALVQLLLKISLSLEGGCDGAS